MERFLNGNIDEMFRISALSSQDKAHLAKMRRVFSSVPELNASQGKQN